ncbi:hypothetical protein DRP77_10305 [Candidatus Poribacteria bacterium]|nr:MAG: hypothetical protein DRP77_10305 [Candidatus Poribacteria bacterium]
MRQRIPLIICFICGLTMAVQFFIPHQYSQAVYSEAVNWLRVIGVFGFVIGFGTLINIHVRRVMRGGANAPYSLVLLLGLFGTIIAWLIDREKERFFDWIFYNVQMPLDSTIFSLLAFFIVSAAYRAFRARTLEATLLLVAAVLVMIGNIPITDVVWGWLAEKLGLKEGLPGEVKDWILAVPNMASRRAIYLGVGLGGVAQSLKIILGIERAHFGGGG